MSHGLCNVSRYKDQRYAEQAPVSTASWPVLPPSTLLALSDDPVGGRDSAGDAATRQGLVNDFLREGDARTPGNDVLDYPLYGKRTSAERLAAVRRVIFDHHGACLFPPAFQTDVHSGRSRVETREQYWRRLAQHFIAETVKSGDSHGDPGEPEDAFYMVDLGCVVEQMALWRRCLPMVRPHFAVKCNPDLVLLELLAALGAGFDCASKAEIELVLRHRLVDSPDDIVFANPCKQIGDLKAAHALGVTYTTFDSLGEIDKIARYLPAARAILRIKTSDGGAVCAFSTKFGAPLEDVDALLRRARERGVEIYGVSFHVGSDNSDVEAYVRALRDAHWVFEQAAAHGFNCTVLDIGGGFPGTRPGSDGGASVGLEVIAAAIRPILVELFSGVVIISEPGRYFSAATHALALHVFGSRRLGLSTAEKEQICASFSDCVCLDEAEEYQYYVNDGLYHSFNAILYDHAHPRLLLLGDGEGAGRGTMTDPSMTPEIEVTTTAASTDVCSPVSTAESSYEFSVDWKTCGPRPLRISTIFGPTCDSLDCILKKEPFPEMRPGDWLLVPDMGSYTTAAGCAFNGFQTRRRKIICSVAIG